MDILRNLHPNKVVLKASKSPSNCNSINRAIGNHAVSIVRASKSTATAPSQLSEINKSITDRLQKLHKLLHECPLAMEGTGNTTSNATDIIKLRSNVRDEIRIVEEEWNRMDTIHTNECRKHKKSKSTIEELEIQREQIQRLKIEINEMKHIHFAKYTTATRKEIGTTTNQVTSILVKKIDVKGSPAKSWDASGLVGTNSNRTEGAVGKSVTLTNHQQQQMMSINERDKDDINRQLDDLGHDLEDLLDIVTLQRDEVQRQTAQLGSIDKKVDIDTRRINTVNKRVEQTVSEVKRPRRFGQITTKDFKLLAGRI